MSISWQEEAAQLRAGKPHHILFLCVANSARSQMAEGIARALAPTDVKISSAGSQPAKLNPLAIRAMAEVGIDISGHYSKSVNDIPPEDVDIVITLCGEEACPVWLGKATRLHWGLPDPAYAGGTEAERLQAFRDVRDELRCRLAQVFPQPDAGAVRFTLVSAAQLDAVRALLDRVRLPAEDIGRSNQTFIGALAGDELVGCVGLEQYGADSLLRSLAVAPRMQGSGMGKKLYAQALLEAERSGTKALYLLTATAAPFFAKVGFSPIDRALAPGSVTASPEFQSLCPASAVCMRLQLPSGGSP